MSTYLKPYNGTYYFRRVVPEELRPLFPTSTGKPRTEWRVSLRTKDKEQAKRELPAWIAKTNDLIDQARAAMAVAEREVALAPSDQQLAASHAIAERMELDSQEAAAFFAEHYAAEKARAEADPLFALDLELRAAKALELRAVRERAEARQVLAEDRAKLRLPLAELFEQFAATPGRHPKTMAQWRPYVGKLAAFIGSDNAHEVTDRDLIAWRNHLRDKERYRGKPLSAKTINDSYLGAVSALFAWAKGDGLIDRNPMIGVTKVAARSAPQLRDKEFTSEESRLILQAALAQPDGRQRADWRNAQRWCPWLLAYSGARVNEITQLRKEDVVTVEGVAALRLTPEAGPIKAKKARTVPLHRHIIEQGFLDFVASRPDGPLFFDPSLRRSDNAINRQANRLGTKLAAWVRSLGIEGVQPNHAWRHLFNTLSARHNLDHRATMAIMGHSSGNVNQRYGSIQVDVLKRELDKLPNFETGS